MEIKINQLLRRYTLREAQKNHKPRLDALTEQLFREYIDLALQQQGYNDKHIVCIRNWYLPISFDPNKTDIEIFDRWLKTVETSLTKLFSQPNPTVWLSYYSHIDAVKSVAIDLATHQLDNNWAWHQMGLVTRTNLNFEQAKSDWMEYLYRHPSTLKAVLVGLAIEGRLDILISQGVIKFDDSVLLIDALFDFAPSWQSILDALNSQFELDWASLLKITNGHVGKHSHDSQHSQYSHSTESHGDTSWWLKHYAKLLTTNVDSSKGLMRTSKLQKDELKCLVFISIMSAWERTGYHQVMSNNADLKRYVFHSMSQIYQQIHQVAGETVNTDSSPLSNRLASSTSASTSLLASVAKQDDNLASFGKIVNEATAVNVQKSQELESNFAGLLFVLNLLKQADWQQRLAILLDTPQPKIHLLNMLAQFLIAAVEEDSAISVFSGEIAKPESLKLEPTVFSSEQQEGFADFAQQLKRELFVILAEPKNKTVEQTFDWLCRRKAYIEYQPGWINLVFEMDTIDTQIRAAGLDLNPDFVPWLGYVVKFYYE